MSKKIKLTQEQRIEKYKKASVLAKPFAYASLSKEDKIFLKKEKKEREKSYVEKSKNFDALHNSFEIRHWNIWFGPKHALKDITVNIEKRKVTTIIGPNGSGKSVLLRSLNRMNTEVFNNVETSGNIFFFNGTNLYSDKIQQVELTTRVGTITQKPTPFPMSIYDNVAYGPRNHGITNKKALDQIVHDALDDAALWDEVKDKLSDYATNLSGGQQQRLCIARAIALKPEVLLMDQPTGGLDPIATTFIENLILQLKNKYTIVVVTHSMTQAQRISDNCLFLYKGSLVEAKPTREMFSNPEHKKTKDFILGR